jgi:serine/threonine protein kinase
MDDPLIGQRLGRYEIRSRIGRGGMGAVYLAWHERLDREVALKVLLPEFADDEGFRERFIRESKVASSLDHPNIVPIYEADEIAGRLYLAMKYIEGSDLKTLMRNEGALELTRTINLLSQIASALDSAHAKGLVHRDVKPANILVASDSEGLERAYLADFGLIKMTTSQTSLTQVGALLGTLDYMAPEQIRGEPVDGRSDEYSLGCVLFECLTGEVPFKKERDVAAMYAVFAHLDKPAPLPSETLTTLPRAIDVVVAKAMAKKPDSRFSTCGDLITGLRAAVEGGDRLETWRNRVARRRLSARTSPRVARIRLLAVVGMVTVGLIVGAGLLLRSHVHVSGSSPHASVGASPSSTSLSPPIKDYPSAVQVLLHQGYVPVSSNGYCAGCQISTILGRPGGCSADCPVSAFFFADNRFVGQDGLKPSIGTTLEWRRRSTVALQYQLYVRTDPTCCPSGGSVLVRFSWSGAHLLRLDPMPPEVGGTTKVGRFVTPPPS